MSIVNVKKKDPGHHTHPFCSVTWSILFGNSLYWISTFRYNTHYLIPRKRILQKVLNFWDARHHYKNTF